jgi:hypothetical protein
MTESFVTLQAQWGDGNNWGSGNFQLIAVGQLQESSFVALVTPVIIGQLDSLGSLSPLGISSPSSMYNQNASPNSGIPILASDNYGSQELLWDIKILVSGADNIIASQIAINYQNGATQGLFQILSQSGWTPPAAASFPSF